MICELCGKDARDGYKVKIEGSLVCACSGCARLGEIVTEVRQSPAPKTQPPQPTPEGGFVVAAEYDFIDGFGARVKAAREKHGWTQDDLGKLINEPHSLIHRIELGKFEPTQEVARNLEHRLGVRLLTPHEEGEDIKERKEDKEITLGDLVVIRKRGK